MITYTWSIRTLQVAPMENGLANVVKLVHYTISAQDAQNTITLPGSTHVGPVIPGSFIPYENLTQSTVIQWIKDILGETATHNQLAVLLNEKANPPTVQLALPWN